MKVVNYTRWFDIWMTFISILVLIAIFGSFVAALWGVLGWATVGRVVVTAIPSYIILMFVGHFLFNERKSRK